MRRPRRPMAAFLVFGMLLCSLSMTLAVAGEKAGAGGRGLPDLTFREGSNRTLPEQPGYGDDVWLFVIVENIGDADYEGSYVIGFWLCWTGNPETSIGLTPTENDADMRDLPAGGSVEVNIVFRTLALEPGNHAISVVVDDENLIAEGNESNNLLSFPFLLPPPVPVDVYVPPGGVTIDPPSPLVGDNVTVNATVANAGPGKARYADVFFYLNDTGQPLGPGQILVNLSPSASLTASVRWSTRGLSPGSGTLLVFVQPAWSLDWMAPDTDGSNNNATFAITLGKPEVRLRLDRFEMAPARPRPGDLLNVSLALANTGSGTVVEVPVVLLLDQEPVYSQHWDLWNGEPGRDLISLSTAGLSEGAHSLRLLAGGLDRELDFNLTVPRADLVAVKMSRLPVLPRAGDNLSFTVEVANAGEIPSPGCNLSLLADLNATPVSRLQLGALLPGHSIRRTLWWNSSNATPGPHDVLATVDAELSVEDSNRSNNALAERFELSGEVDLSLENLEIAPAAPSQGESVLFSVLVRNRGSMRCLSANLTLKVEGRSVDRVPLAGLAPGESVDSALEWNTTGFAPGSHEYEVAVAPGGGQGGSGMAPEGLSGRLELLPRPPRPDLRVAALTVPNGAVEVGDLLTLGLLVENVGDNESGACCLTVVFELSGPGGLRFPQAPLRVPALPAGRSARLGLSANSSAFTPGTYTVNATVDAGNEVPESDETDNWMLGEVVLHPPSTARAVLSLSRIFVEGPLEDGRRVVFHAEVKNTGGAEALDVKVSFLIDGKVIGTRSLDRIPPNENRSCALEWVAAGGSHTFGVKLTSGGDFSDFDQLPLSVSGSGLAAVSLAAALGLGGVLLLAAAGALALWKRRAAGKGPRGPAAGEEE